MGDKLRFGALTVLVVVVVVAARVRAAGSGAPTPVDPQALSSVFDTVIGLGTVVVLAAGTLLLLSGARVRQVTVRAAEPEKPVNFGRKRPNRRLVLAVLGGCLLALLFVVVVHPDQARTLIPPSMSPFSPGSPQGGVQSVVPGAQADSGNHQKVVLITVLLIAGALIVTLLRRSTVIEEKEELDQKQAMVRAVQAGRKAVLDRTISDPREAIVACFVAMEDALAGYGGDTAPLLSDTPSEVLERGIERASLPASAAYTLLRLFREAQFSTHPMTAGDRADADESLGQLLRPLGVPTGDRVQARDSRARDLQ